MNRNVSRRALLAGAATVLGCSPRKGTRFPGYALVANGAGQSVAAVDLEKFAVARQIAVDSQPAAVLGRRHAAYVLCPQAGVVGEIEAASLRCGRRARLGGPALAMCLDWEGRDLWVLQERMLVQVPLDRMSPAARLRLPASATDFDVSGTGRAAVIFRQERRVGVLQLAGGGLEHMLEGGADPAMVRFRSDGRQVLIGDRGSRMVLIGDVASGRTVVRLPIPMEPAEFCFSPDGGQLFISGSGMDAVAIVYPYDTEVAEAVLAGQAPGCMAVSAAPAYLFVSNPQSGRITVLDIDYRKLVAVVPVGEEPGPIVLTPDNQYALVLNRRSGDVAVVRLAAFTNRHHKTNPAPLFTMIPVGPRPVSGAVVAV